MRIHSYEAWEIASHYSGILASDTRTLAAQIDGLIDAKLEAAAKTADAHLLIDWTDKASPEVAGATRMQQAISKTIREMKRKTEDDK